MTVFRIKNASGQWQSISPTDPKVFGTALFEFDCIPKLNNWNPPDFYITNPKLKEGDFFCFLNGSVGFYERVLDDSAMALLLRPVGELLPITIDRKQAYLLNVLNCTNCLNGEASVWFVDPTTNQRCFLKQYVFYGNRTPKAEIFKIPETSRSEMLVASDAQCYEADDFYLWYKKGGYTGLDFVELWSCD